MMRRATKTAYFLNRALKRLALIGQSVRFPATPGIWVLAAEAARSPREVLDLLTAVYPGAVREELRFVTLLTDFDVEEFERSLQGGAPC